MFVNICVDEAKLALCHDEVRILIFDDPAENERGQRPKFCFTQLYSTYPTRAGRGSLTLLYRLDRHKLRFPHEYYPTMHVCRQPRAETYWIC